MVETIVEKKLEIIEVQEELFNSAEQLEFLTNPIDLPLILPKTGSSL